MNIDIELYRREVRIASNPLVRLSAIDISPEMPRRTLVFLHGFGGQANQWRYQLQQFSLDNRVIALDLRGHGRSDGPPEGYDMPRVVEDVRMSVDALSVQAPFVLVGHSFGGAVAAEFAAAYPDLLSGLVLVATAGEFHLNPLYRLGLALPVSVLRFVNPFVQGWLSAPPHILKRWYIQNLGHWRGWQTFARIRTPTLVLRGHRDRVFAGPFFERVAQSISDAEDVDIGVSGHMVMIERRDALNRALSRFLDGEMRRSWRDSHIAVPRLSRDALRQTRPWLNHYEKGVPYTIGVPQVPLHHLLRSAVRRFAGRTAIQFEGSAMTYRRLNWESNRFANALLGLGLGKGARVVLLMPNIPQMLIGFFGVLKAGCVAVFLPPANNPDELMRQVKDSEASLLVTISMWSGLARQIRENTGIPHIVITDAAEYLPVWKLWISRWRNRGLRLPEALRWRHWMGGRSNKSPEIDVAPSDLAVIQYTGGTTAEAKGVMLSHRSLVANALQTRQWLPDAQEGRERFLCVLPLSHAYGLTTALTVPVAIGATMILKPTFNVIDVLKTIRRYRLTIFPGVPSMYVAINNFRDVRKYNVGSIRACISGSAPLPVEVQEAFEKLTRGRLVEGYGLTEAGPVTHANPINGMRKVGSIGIPLPSTEARIVDLKTGKKEMPNGQIGELAVRGPQVMLGYWNNPEATRRVLSEDGWLLTGDVAVRDSDGYFRIVARKADMWYPEKPGTPAFPRDVEEVLYEIPQVQEAAVVAVAGAPVAFIISSQREHPQPSAVIAYCQRRLPPALVPKLVIFVDDFPRTFIGKVLRRELARRVDLQEKLPS